MKKFIFIALFLVGALFVSSCAELPEKSNIRYMGGGGGGGGGPYCGDGNCDFDETCQVCEEDCGSCVTEYPYRIEIKEHYDIYDGSGSSIEKDVLEFTAIGWESQDKGFKVGSFETGRVVIVVPTSVRGLWGPIYYEDSDGVFQEYFGMNFKIIPATGNGESAQVWYNPFEGQINIGGEDLTGDHLVLLRWMSTGKCDVSAFNYFGYHPDTSEADELYIWNIEGSGECGEGGYYGKCEEEIQVGNYMVIHEPDLYLENEEFAFSFYL